MNGYLVFIHCEAKMSLIAARPANRVKGNQLESPE